VQFIQENPKKQFDNSKHSDLPASREILDLARSLGAKCKNLPRSSNWPLTWPDKVYGWLLKIYYKGDGTLHDKQTQAIKREVNA
jgi:hypothetical protein